MNMVKRGLNMREAAMLCFLLVLAAAAGYLYLFRNPTVQAAEGYRAGEAECRAQMELYGQQLAEKARMEKELKELFAKDPNPLSMSPYDNLKKIVVELNGILQPMRDYTLTFGKIQEEGDIVQRPVTLGFSCSGYPAAKEVLRQLHDSSYRCLLNSISISIPDGTGSAGGVGLFGWTGAAQAGDRGVSVQATMTYFEYREDAEKAPAE